MSTNACKVFPNAKGKSDSLGYDFKFEDTENLFASKNKCLSPICYVEVKGCDSPFKGTFFVSENEKNVANKITKTGDRSLYMIVILDNLRGWFYASTLGRMLRLL